VLQNRAGGFCAFWDFSEIFFIPSSSITYGSFGVWIFKNFRQKRAGSPNGRDVKKSKK
jgi:hypothetical protein